MISLFGGLAFFSRWIFSGHQFQIPNASCPSGEWLRGGAGPVDGLCTYRGAYHLAWAVPMMDPTYYSQSGFIHLFTMFAPFFLSSSFSMWVQGAFLFATGPILASYITSNLQEAASIWCFFSIAQIAVMVFILATSMGMNPKAEAATPRSSKKK
jgi:hypothetical protein